MPIRAVVNGYFRSGTTWLWHGIREGLPGHVAFYEPLHPMLPLLVAREGRSSAPDPLHGERLWGEYRALPEARRRALFTNHPNLDAPGVPSAEAARRYFDLFHEMEADVVLQPNRAAFLLDLLHERYGARLVHVIRHPVSVWRSLRAAAAASPRWERRAAKRLLRPVLLPSQFDLRRDALWIRRRLGLPAAWLDRWSVRARLAWSALDMFALVWTVANRNAIAAVERAQGLLLVYEELAEAPEAVQPRLESALGGPLRSPLASRGPDAPPGAAELGRFRRAVGRLELEEELHAVRDAVWRGSGRDYLAARCAGTASRGARERSSS